MKYCPQPQRSQLSTGEIAPFRLNSAQMKYPPQAVICASSTGGHRRFVPRQGVSSTIRHCRAGAGASAGACALCLIGPSPACIRHRRRDTAPWTHSGDAWRQDEQTNCACSLKDAKRVSGQRKSRTADRKMNSFIFGLLPGFCCALCAQPGQRSWPARKRLFASSLQLRKAACSISYAVSAYGGDEPPMTACGGYFIGGEISRNEQVPMKGTCDD